MTEKKRSGPKSDHKRILVVETGKVYDTYYAAANAIGGNRGDIYLYLNGFRKSHKGYTFEYVD